MSVIRVTACTAVAIALLAGSGSLWLYLELTTPYWDPVAPEVFVEIGEGSGAATVASLLAEAGVVRSRFLFQAYVRWSGLDRQLKAGEYRFTMPATPSEVARRIAEGDIYYHAVTIPEGLTMQETISAILGSGLGQREELERAVRRADWIGDLDPRASSLEGYLFPDTYRFPHDATSEEIIRSAVQGFRKKYAALLSVNPLQRGWTVRRVVTLASMVEKETGSGSERPLVASVLANRLARGIRLACDPTIIYALKLAGSYDGNIRKKDLALDTPYNTYTHSGLPPGPICSPGQDSLRAALAPPETGYLYFVSRNDGTHQFSKDFDSHTKAVNRYQKRLQDAPPRR